MSASGLEMANTGMLPAAALPVAVAGSPVSLPTALADTRSLGAWVRQLSPSDAAPACCDDVARGGTGVGGGDGVRLEAGVAADADGHRERVGAPPVHPPVP